MEASFRTPDFRLLFESGPGALLVLAPDLTIVAVTDEYARATKRARDDLVGCHLFDAFPDDSAALATRVADLRASLARVLSTGRPDTMAVQKRDIRERGGGAFEERHSSLVSSPILGDDGAVRYIVHRIEDVTELVRLGRQRDEAERLGEELAREVSERRRAEVALEKSEAQLRQAQKLEELGRIAGGMAHDFNNLLSVILSYSDILLEQAVPDSPGTAELEEIRRAGLRAADLTRQMLAFSRQQVLEPRVVDLNEVIANVCNMIARLIGEDVVLRVVHAPELGRVRADPGQLEQVIVNLVVNARDAMPRGGKLTIATANAEIADDYARDHLGVAPGQYVVMSVSDTGVGIDKATQARVFEPFFTTKLPGKGTGLGLSTVFGIVKQSGGHVWLYSEPDVGTTLRVYLPRVDAPLDGPGSMQRSGAVGGSETLLLVEDEDQVRQVATEILRRAGYHVLDVRGPGEALLVCEQHPAAIHLLLTDVVMPMMNGRQLAERVAARRPTTRVLFMSGHTGDAIAHRGMLDSGAAFVQKPLTPEALARKVREVLDQPRRR